MSPCCDTNTHGVPAARPAESVIIQSNNRSIPNDNTNQSIDRYRIISVKQVSGSSIPHGDTFPLVYVKQVVGLRSNFCLSLYFTALIQTSPGHLPQTSATTTTTVIQFRLNLYCDLLTQFRPLLSNYPDPVLVYYL